MGCYRLFNIYRGGGARVRVRVRARVRCHLAAPQPQPLPFQRFTPVLTRNCGCALVFPPVSIQISKHVNISHCHETKSLRKLQLQIYVMRYPHYLPHLFHSYYNVGGTQFKFNFANF